MRALLAMLLAAACGSSSPRRAPEPEVPDGVSVTVTIDGVAAAAIDGARLRATTRAPEGWLLAELAGDAITRADGVVELVGATGGRTRHVGPSRAALRVVLKDGALRLAPRDPADRRDPSVRLGAITAVEARLLADEEIADPAEAKLAEPLVLRAGDGSTRRFLLEDLERIAPLSVRGAGSSRRPGWPVDALVGDGANGVELIGENGQKVVIDAAAWKDPARRATLRLNRQGALKLVWVGPNSVVTDGPALRGVTEIVVR